MRGLWQQPKLSCAVAGERTELCSAAAGPGSRPCQHSIANTFQVVLTVLTHNTHLTILTLHLAALRQLCHAVARERPELCGAAVGPGSGSAGSPRAGHSRLDVLGAAVLVFQIRRHFPLPVPGKPCMCCVVFLARFLALPVLTGCSYGLDIVAWTFWVQPCSSSRSADTSRFLCKVSYPRTISQNLFLSHICKVQPASSCLSSARPSRAGHSCLDVLGTALLVFYFRRHLPLPVPGTSCCDPML